MVALSKVLVPTDFSGISERALAYARTLAEMFTAELHLLHVLPDPYTQVWSIEALSIDVSAVLRGWEEDARQHLEEMQPHQDKSEVAIRVGHPVVEIVRYVREREIDLIVMGNDRRGLIARLFVDNVAEKVVQDGSCPVLIVSQDPSTLEGP